MGPQKVRPPLARVDLGVMTMKGQLTFPKALGLEPHHQIQFSVIPRTFFRGRVLCQYRDAVRIFNNPSQQGDQFRLKKKLVIPYFCQGLYKCITNWFVIELGSLSSFPMKITSAFFICKHKHPWEIKQKLFCTMSVIFVIFCKVIKKNPTMVVPYFFARDYLNGLKIDLL